MDILDRIVEKTRETVETRKRQVPEPSLRAQIMEVAPPRSLKQRIADWPRAVIAEFKRKSPSRPNIASAADPASVAESYAAGGAAAISVLTEPHFFAGSLEDLHIARAHADIPLLRKDFMVDAYQFYEARAAGADLVLLIARILDRAQVRDFCALAHDLGMEILFEIHEPAELEKVGDIDFLGVNCRDLKQFTTSLDHLVQLAPQLPAQFPLVAESGIGCLADVHRLAAAGYRGFLVGETLMRAAQPAQLIRDFQHG